jgi:soluble lytic murein transglycosylase
MYRLALCTRPRALAAALILSCWRPAPAADLVDYLHAEQSIKSGDRAAFQVLSAALRDYPLYPYLRFAELTRDLDRAPDEAIEAFLEQYPDTPLAERLRAVYLKRLARAERWTDYARIYRPDDSLERRCLYLRALLATGRPGEALSPAALEPLWLVPRSQPAACDPLFDAWDAAGGLTTERIWARVRLAMDAAESGLARHLGDRLPETERAWLRRWLAVQAQPALVLDPQTLSGSHPQRAAILADGIGRLVRKSPRQAAAALESALADGALRSDPAAWDEAHRAVGRVLTRSKDPADQTQGLAVWDRMSARADNLVHQETRLRAAIGLGAWDRVAEWVRRMPDGDEKRDRWLYWQARAELALGREAESRETFRQAATSRSLWGFLAADRVGLPYRLADTPAPVEPERAQRMAARPALARIRELERLGRETDMRREWRTLTRDLDKPDLMAAALVADGLGWYDQAIFTLARTDYWDDLRLRFPLAYKDLVAEQAWQTGLTEDWIMAVIRQESVFAPQVASPVGALGLMQLMPATARELAQDPDLSKDLDLDRSPLGRSELLNPVVNIALGSAYLARMRDRFGHAALATAAYNAGPGRVSRWLPQACTDADLWIASIPYDETRGYVERVLAYRVIYGARLGLEPLRIAELLPPVPGVRRTE